ncbi:hypothetical protein LIER_17078 [Lithospermum erythrorhizon]|uniref:Uncharacterized protein n=1 Tax=Lithospermum erythrorhizon TaxID=34254 RepID=A0AAV3Q913_LITER
MYILVWTPKGRLGQQKKQPRERKTNQKTTGRATWWSDRGQNGDRSQLERSKGAAGGVAVGVWRRPHGEDRNQGG